MFNRYPYTNFHDLNLDWMLEEMTLIAKDIQDLTDWKEARAERDAYYDQKIDELTVNRTKVNGLTASAYDAAALTAAAYDALELSAYDYDFNGADYIGN